MASDQPYPNERIARAVEQAIELRATIRDDPELRELLDLLLFELAQRVAKQIVDET